VDNRRLIKWLDVRYHANFPIFKRTVEPLMAMSQKLRVIHRRPDGSERLLIEYVEPTGGWEWEVSVGKKKIDLGNISRYFEDTNNISDEEWDLFAMCEPEANAMLGQITLQATDAELFLTGKTPAYVEKY
jgi:hypothetical protein